MVSKLSKVRDLIEDHHKGEGWISEDLWEAKRILDSVGSSGVEIVAQKQAQDIGRLRDRVTELERQIVLIGERAVVDFDDVTVGGVDRAVPDGKKYRDWLEWVLTRARALDWCERNCLDVRCMSEATGGDDYQEYWVIIEHYMDEPQEREIGRGGTSSMSIVGIRL